jgi:hypothetical protein
LGLIGKSRGTCSAPFCARYGTVCLSALRPTLALSSRCSCAVSSTTNGHPRPKPLKLRSAKRLLEEVSRGLGDIRPVDPEAAARAVFQVLNHYLDPGQVENVREALSEPVRRLWPLSATLPVPERQHAPEPMET